MRRWYIDHRSIRKRQPQRARNYGYNRPYYIESHKICHFYWCVHNKVSRERIVIATLAEYTRPEKPIAHRVHRSRSRREDPAYEFRNVAIIFGGPVRSASGEAVAKFSRVIGINWRSCLGWRSRGTTVRQGRLAGSKAKLWSYQFTNVAITDW